jgi:hypothetical protein
MIATTQGKGEGGQGRERKRKTNTDTQTRNHLLGKVLGGVLDQTSKVAESTQQA